MFRIIRLGQPLSYMTFNSSFASLVSEILMILSSSVEYPRTLTLPYQMAVLSMIQAHNDSFGTILMNNP